MTRRPHIDGPAPFVETWSAIATLVGRSERWCRDRAMREEDPLPVTKFAGRVRLNIEAAKAWAERQERRRVANIEAVNLNRAAVGIAPKDCVVTPEENPCTSDRSRSAATTTAPP
jgi:hypothetical protein